MTLYEMIVIARANTAKSTTGLIQQVASQILEKGGNVRNATVLGDRILNRALKGNDDKKHLVGRYLQILYDGNPSMHRSLEKTTCESNEALQENFKIHLSPLPETPLRQGVPPSAPALGKAQPQMKPPNNQPNNFTQLRPILYST